MHNDEVIPTKLIFLHKHSFFIFIFSSIIISFGIVVISMTLYNSSGAAQLDLSRPGYKDIRGQVEMSSSEFAEYSASGPMNSKTIAEFKLLYGSHAAKVKSVDAFGGDPLSLDELGINDTNE